MNALKKILIILICLAVCAGAFYAGMVFRDDIMTFFSTSASQNTPTETPTYSETEYGEYGEVQKQIGYDEGYNVGYDEGYNVGYDEGYNVGYDDGYNVGYDDGYNVGYDAGLTDAETETDGITIELYNSNFSLLFWQGNTGYVLNEEDHSGSYWINVEDIKSTVSGLITSYNNIADYKNSCDYISTAVEYSYRVIFEDNGLSFFSRTVHLDTTYSSDISLELKITVNGTEVSVSNYEDYLTNNMTYSTFITAVEVNDEVTGFVYLIKITSVV